ncbi:hypothetical protein GCM10020220_090060 [Nonomuraea rubra]
MRWLGLSPTQAGRLPAVTDPTAELVTVPVSLTNQFVGREPGADPPPGRLGERRVGERGLGAGLRGGEHRLGRVVARVWPGGLGLHRAVHEPPAARAGRR